MEKIGVIGVGRLGLCLALNLERAGYDVLGMDVREEYLDTLRQKTLKTNEPLVKEMLEKSNISFTSNLKKIVEEANIIFVVVATPSLESGKYDHSQIEDIVDKLENYRNVFDKDLIINATTMPGYCDTVQERLKNKGWSVSYNPEFIAQGNIVREQRKPDMVLIGEANKISGNIISSIYTKMCDNTPEIHRMSAKSAEITKLSLNCFLTTKITFANMVGDICEHSNAETDKVLRAVGSDTRVGKKYLNYGFGYGGPCFPRDNRALGIYARDLNIIPSISEATDEYNEHHREYQLRLLNKKNKIVMKEGVAYKPGTDILTESQQLEFALDALKEGFEVEIVDIQENIDKVKEKYPEAKFKYTVKAEGV